MQQGLSDESEFMDSHLSFDASSSHVESMIKVRVTMVLACRVDCYEVGYRDSAGQYLWRQEPHNLTRAYSVHQHVIGTSTHLHVSCLHHRSRSSRSPYRGGTSSCLLAIRLRMPAFCSVPRPVAARVPHVTPRRCVAAQVASHPMDPSIQLADFRCVSPVRY